MRLFTYLDVYIYRHHPPEVIYVGCYADVRPWKTEIVWAHVVWFITCAWSNWIYYLNVLPNVQMNRPSETSQEKYTDKTSLAVRHALLFTCFGPSSNVFPALLYRRESLQKLNFMSIKTEINNYKYRQYGQKGNAWGLASRPAFLCRCIPTCQWWKTPVFSLPLMLTGTQHVLPDTHRWQEK